MRAGFMTASLIAVLAIAGAAGSASAMSTQAAPVGPSGSNRLVDPDERADAMADSTRRSDAQAYRQSDLDTRNLVAPYGPAASFGPAAAFSLGSPHR